MCSLRKGGALANMTVPSRQFLFGITMPDLREAGRTPKKSRQGYCPRKIGRQDTARAYRNCSGTVNNGTVLHYNMRLAAQ